MGDCICDRRRGWPLPGFAASEKRLTGTIDNMNLDAVGDRVEAQDRIGLPVDAGDPPIVEGNAFIQGPTHRLHDRAFDLVDQPVRIDHLTAVDRRHRANQPRTPGLPIDFYLGSNSAIGRQILVARKSEPESPIQGRFSSAPPSKTLRGFLNYFAPTEI